MPKVIAAITAAGLHVVRISNLAANICNYIHMQFLGKVIIATLKLIGAVLRIGMPIITCIGIAYDIYTMYDLAKGKQCSESKIYHSSSV